MRRWSALVEIVRSFNEGGSPVLAFASVLAFLIAPILLAALAVFKLP